MDRAGSMSITFRLIRFLSSSLTAASCPLFLNNFTPFWDPYWGADEVASRLVYSLITYPIQCSWITEPTILSCQYSPSMLESNFRTAGGLQSGNGGSSGPDCCSGSILGAWTCSSLSSLLLTVSTDSREGSSARTDSCVDWIVWMFTWEGQLWSFNCSSFLIDHWMRWDTLGHSGPYTVVPTIF